MRGSPLYQARRIYREVDRIGQSKHEAKARARKSGACSWAEVGGEIGVFSYATADAYRDVWRRCLLHLRETRGLRDIEKLSGDDVRAYLESRIDETVALSTYRLEAAALTKLEQALTHYAERNRTGRKHDFKSPIQTTRKLAAERLKRFRKSRAYAVPRRLLASVESFPFAVAARFQHETGGRIRELALIRPDQLEGMEVDPHTGELRGRIRVKGKGGKVYALHPTPETYQWLEHFIEEHGPWRLPSKAGYREALRHAADASVQEYHASHGLRWNRAQERMLELQQAGKTYEEALAIVSHEMGHRRPDITEHYLR